MLTQPLIIMAKYSISICVGSMKREHLSTLEISIIAIFDGRSQEKDRIRHFGLVVDDKEKVRATLNELGIDILPGRFLDFLDPWGNHVQIVDYRDISFVKTEEVLQDMGLGELNKRKAV